MSPQLIGIREFRQHCAEYAEKAKKGKGRFIILKNNEPLFELKPIDKKEFAIALLEAEIAERRKEKGYITQEEMMKKYGIL